MFKVRERLSLYLFRGANKIGTSKVVSTALFTFVCSVNQILNGIS